MFKANSKNFFLTMAIIVLVLIGIGIGVLFNSSRMANPQLPGAARQLTTIDQTAVPTVLDKSRSVVPVVKLNWAYANSKLLSIDITITGLDGNVNLDDVVCDPYLVTEPPIQYGDSLTRDVKRFADQPGNPVELTYQYSLSSVNARSLDIDMILTLGPCARYLQFQESNVTPAAPLPPLIAAYHFTFRVPVEQ